MKIIISPAKKMNIDWDSPIVPQLPQFLPQAEVVRERLQTMSPAELQRLWRCNDAIAQQNIQRLEGMDLRRRLTPAIFAYEGLQYRNLAPNVLETEQLGYLQENLRILSGFYGLLRPFDGVTPYRLEMGSKLSVAGEKNLYAFWGDRLARALTEEGEWIVNLASQEYSRAITPHLPAHYPFVTCVFGQWKGATLVEKGTMCKMARGRMVRWMAEEGVAAQEELQQFSDLGYVFAPDHSTQNQITFIKE